MPELPPTEGEGYVSHVLHDIKGNIKRGLVFGSGDKPGTANTQRSKAGREPLLRTMFKASHKQSAQDLILGRILLFVWRVFGSAHGISALISTRPSDRKTANVWGKLVTVPDMVSGGCGRSRETFAAHTCCGFQLSWREGSL